MALVPQLFPQCNWYLVPTQLTWGLLSTVSALTLCTRDYRIWDKGFSISWFPCQGSCRISGGTIPHPDPAQQVHLPCDPHCSLLSSQGRCSRRSGPPTPSRALFSYPCTVKAGCGIAMAPRALARARPTESRQPAQKGACTTPTFSSSLTQYQRPQNHHLEGTLRPPQPAYSKPVGGKLF